VLQERRSKLVESQNMMSTVTPLVTEPPAAARAGADLREARERLGLSLQDVAFELRIRMPHLEALEEGRISLLPGNAYALAFVRTYANALGLDAEEMVRRFRTAAAEFGRRTELVFPVPMPERGLPAGAVLLLGVVLAVGAYVGWYRLSGEGRLPAETVTAIPERLAPLAEQALPPPPGSPTPSSPTPSSPTPSSPTTGAFAQGSAAPGSASASVAGAPDTTAPRIVLADPATAAMLATPAPPVMAVSPSSAAAAQLPPQPADAAAAAGLSPAPAAVPLPVGASLGAYPGGAYPGGAYPGGAYPGGAYPRAPPSGADAGRVVLRASADAWIQVKDRGGVILLNRTLKAGETWSVPPRPDLLMTTGNAGGTDILVDGAPTPSLGGSGTVRHDMSLDPDQIKEGKLAGALAPQLVSTRARQ
jgi:cytoskeleton protein RodZ